MGVTIDDQTVLSGRSVLPVETTPFPHLVLEPALPESVVSQLISEAPPLARLAGSNALRSNRRFDLSAAESLSGTYLSPVWRRVIETHVSQRFLNEFVSTFGSHLRALYPDIETRLGKPLEALRAGVRFRDDPRDHDVLLDALVSVNTPVIGRRTSVRRIHLDLPNKLFAGLLYLRHPDDQADGGDLQLCRYRDDPRGFSDAEIPDRYVDVVKTVTYGRNVLVLYPNSIDALHGVTPREPTPFSRLFINLVGELSFPLFDLAPLQERNLRNAIPAWIRKPLSRIADRLR